MSSSEHGWCVVATVSSECSGLSAAQPFTNCNKQKWSDTERAGPKGVAMAKRAMAVHGKSIRVLVRAVGDPKARAP